MKRQVKCQDPLTSVIPEPAQDPRPGLMRMKDAREAVPRKENESRSQWKNRVFEHKRREEEKHGQGGRSKGSGKRG